MKPGFFLLIDEPNLSSEIEQLVKRGESFTVPLSLPDFRPSKREVFLVSFDGKRLGAIALGVRGRTVTTGRKSVQMQRVHRLKPSVELSELTEDLPSRLKTHFVRTSAGTGSRVPPATWNALIDALTVRDSEIVALLRSFDAVADERVIHPNASFTEERDAINLAVRCAGLDPNAVMQRADIEMQAESKLPHFLQTVRETKVLEDFAIYHDTNVFADWLPVTAHVSGAVTFENSNRRVTVMNVNKTEVERVLGVDMIYYAEEFDSFTTVQYKRMTREGDGGKFAYRPLGETYEAELKRMLDADSKFNKDAWTSLKAFRLHPGAFYFKLIYDHSFDPTSASLLKGMYIPLEYWLKLVTDDACRGPQGGVQVTHENARRYITGDFFVELVKGGWIGSRGADSAFIADVITRSLEMDRQVVLARAKKL